MFVLQGMRKGAALLPTCTVVTAAAGLHLRHIAPEVCLLHTFPPVPYYGFFAVPETLCLKPDSSPATDMPHVPVNSESSFQESR